MKQSELFTKTVREAPKDEVALNAKLLIRGGFVSKETAGVYTILPLGYRVLERITRIVREEMVKLGGQEILMPVLHPKENWVQTGRWDSLDILFKLKSQHGYEYALGPTHEEIVSPLLGRFISSYKDLPRYVFQIQDKFRDEKRAKSGLLRGREFLMKDLYSFHSSEADLDSYYEKVKKGYSAVFRRLGLGGKTYLTFASGGSFAKYSHEFQTVTDAGEDLIYICGKCKIAVNKEIVENEQPVCPNCGAKNLRAEKAVEVGNIFKLKTKYSAPFRLAYRDERGNMNDVVMGCYGIGITRLMGTIVEAYHDDRGIVWPEGVSPFRFHLIELKKGLGKELYRRLTSRGDEVLYDDREVSAGEKFADADLIGIPYRLVVSDKTKGKIEIKKRNSKTSKLVSYATVSKLL